MLEYQGYLGVVEADEGAFIGRFAGLRDVVTFEGAMFAEVEQAFRDSVDDYLACCAERGDPPRPALKQQNLATGRPGPASPRRHRLWASASTSGSPGD
jgi:predicted HicB family RNase H-like nuclease